MSRPLMWNGTAWVDPSFNTAPDVWKTYLAPVYNVSALDSQFTTGWDGWQTSDTNYGWDPAGHVWVAGMDTFIYGDATLEYKPYPYDYGEFSGMAGHQIRIQMRYRLRPGTNPVTNSTGRAEAKLEWIYPESKYSQLSLDMSEIPVDSTWRTAQGPTVLIPQTAQGAQAIITASVNFTTGKLGGVGEIAAYLDLDYFQLWDVTTNQPLKELGVPGWEPKIYRSNGEWK